MGAVTIKVVGLDELQKKLGHAVLLDPAAEDALETIGARIAKPSGKKIGVLRNKIGRHSAGHLKQNVTTTLAEAGPHYVRKGATRRPGTPRPGWQKYATWYNPRLKGQSWFKYQQKLVRGAFGRNVIKAMVRKIEARWAS